MFDAYSRTARLSPAILASLPVLAILIAGASAPWTPLGTWSLASGCAAFVVIAFVRDRGKVIQTRLWDKWDGPPASQRLRWRDNNHHEVARLHHRVWQATQIQLADADAEELNPREADAGYEDAVGALRDLTRDQTRFPLVFEENANYGWRRNSLGLRPIAVAIAALVLSASVTILAFEYDSADARARWIPALLISGLAILWWVLVVTDAWVRRAAELYADRLFEAAHTLSRESSKGT